MALGQAIRKRRKLLNLTLQQLAKRVSAHSGNLSRIERSAQGISEAMLLRLCSALDCTPTYLYSHAESVSSVSAQTKPQFNSLEPQEFVRWFRSAAERGHGIAQQMLGRYLARALAGDTDLPQARTWFERAGAQGVDVVADLAALPPQAPQPEQPSRLSATG